MPFNYFWYDIEIELRLCESQEKTAYILSYVVFSWLEQSVKLELSFFDSWQQAYIIRECF